MRKLPTNKKEMIEFQKNRGFVNKVKNFLGRKKYKISVNNKLKGALGEMNPDTNEIQINVKKHKGDKAELASTIKHELTHVKYPKMTEKEVYKRTAKTKIPLQEQNQLLAKLKHKMSYKEGALKRKFKMGRVKTKPGDFISKMNEKKMLAIKGLV